MDTAYDAGVPLLIDPPSWTAWGRQWSHLVSDTSIEELHDFAASVALDPRAFEGDHYDVPEELYAACVAAGAREVPGRDLLKALKRSGLRMQKRKGDKGVRRVLGVTLGDGTSADIDLISSRRIGPDKRTFAAMVFLSDDEGSLAVVHSRRRDQWGSPGGWREGSESVRANAVREVREETGLVLAEDDLVPCGYERFVRRDGAGGLWQEGRDILQCFTARAHGVRPPMTRVLDDTTDRRWVTPADYAALCSDQFWWPLAARSLGL